VATCFLFVEHLDEEQCLCLRLDQQGRVEAPLAMRVLDEIRAMQDNHRTVVVLSAVNSTLHEVELPWLHERKARAAIPYALEEKVADSVSNLHFAFDRQQYQNNRYLVAVTQKQWLENLISTLDDLDLDFDVITLDWFALHTGEAAVTETGLLVNDSVFKGGLSVDLAGLYLKNSANVTPVLMFRDSALELQNDAYDRIDAISYTWIAQRLFQINGLNLCQGEFRHDTRGESNRFWYRATGILAGVWLFSVLVIGAIHWHILTRDTAVLDQKIAVIYHEFFPEAERVISPEFRIGQLLKSNGQGQDAQFWSLLETLSVAFDKRQETVEQFRFQNKALSVVLVVNDFEALEQLQIRLQRAHVKVVQTEASSRKQKVVATLELSL